MFRTSITLLTLVSTLLHAVLGCCAHHGHAQVAETVSTQTIAVVRHSCSCCGHYKPRAGKAATKESQDGGHDDEHDGHRHSPCDEPSCQLLTVQKAEVPAANQLSSHEIASAVVVFSTDLTLLAQAAERLPNARRSGLPPGLTVRDVTQIRLL